MILGENELSQEIDNKYLLSDLYHVLVYIENDVIERVKIEKLLGKEDDIDLLVPALTSSLSLLRQIIYLCEKGFPDGALMLARNIYEQMIICSFIESQEDDYKRNELLKKYFQDAELIKLKYQKELSKRFGLDEEVHKTSKLIREHNEKFGSSVKQQYWWAEKKTFRALSDEITQTQSSHRGLFNNMHMEYKLACIALHPSAFGNRMNIGSDIVGVDMRARVTGHENALFLAVSSLITLVGYTYDYLELDSCHVLMELNRLGIYYLELLQKQNIKNDL